MFVICDWTNNLMDEDTFDTYEDAYDYLIDKLSSSFCGLSEEDMQEHIDEFWIREYSDYREMQLA